jgi:sigma-B regulation protein RsbU (phosphoserine phosphatase)
VTADSDPWYELAACGLLLTDEDGGILQANALFCHALGYNDLPQQGVATFQSLLTGSGKIVYQTHMQPLVQQQGAVAEIKFDFLHRDGPTVVMVVNARKVTLADGGVAHSIAAFVAADRERHEQALLKARTEAEQLLRERTDLQREASERGLFAEQLIGIVSHDLRNPLTAIRIGTEMLVMNESDPAQLRLSRRINLAVDRALSLVEDMLDFTLTKTGRSLDIERNPIDLHQVIAIGIDELRLSFPAIVLEHRQQGDGAVQADAGRLVRVLGNLVANAARYGDARRPITVSTSVSGDAALLEVHNFGTPIEPALLPHLFQAMSRGAGVHGGGVGLGLYIVSQVAQAHGGRPTASSSEAHGTRMGIEFPVRPASAAA